MKLRRFMEMLMYSCGAERYTSDFALRHRNLRLNATVLAICFGVIEDGLPSQARHKASLNPEPDRPRGATSRQPAAPRGAVHPFLLIPHAKEERLHRLDVHSPGVPVGHLPNPGFLPRFLPPTATLYIYQIYRFCKDITHLA